MGRYIATCPAPSLELVTGGRTNVFPHQGRFFQVCQQVLFCHRQEQDPVSVPQVGSQQGLVSVPQAGLPEQGQVSVPRAGSLEQERVSFPQAGLPGQG
jgi:hypothetical protein